jgi:catechol 2,3-dioxygenase-like lactoylglutathione lyase family enzyme
MGIRRIVPDIVSNQPDLCREFYSGFLGLRVAMDMGWIATYVSPTNPTAQVNIVRGEGSQVPQPSVSVEVEDVDRVYGEAVARGYRIVYPLTDEPWGVRRFFVADPNGVVLNVMSHSQPSAGGQSSAEPGAAADDGRDPGSS